MTRTKTILTALMLLVCMSALSVPAFAADTTDKTPPTVTAAAQENVLHIEASDADSGVEAVFVDGERINYRVDSALDLLFADYAKDGEYVTIYAIDFAGNKSEEVRVKNPGYQAPEVPKEPKPFTPSGTGTVQDNATDADGKEFFTIITPDDNEFFLVIDRQRESDNVYLLNAVTEEDLAALAKQGEKPAPTPDPTPEPTPEPEPEAPPAKGGVSGGTVFFLLLAAAAAGGAGYYFKIYKPKQQAALPDEFDEDEEYEDDFDDADIAAESDPDEDEKQE